MKRFVANSFFTGITWLMYNTFFFVIYFLIAAPMIISLGGFGTSPDTLQKLQAFRIIFAVFLLLLIGFCIGFFRLGRKVLYKCSHPIWTFLSCFSAYAVIAACILRSSTQLAFTRSFLEVAANALLPRAQEIQAYVDGLSFAYFERDILCSDIATSNEINALFALVPFIIAYIGLCTRKQSASERRD